MRKLWTLLVALGLFVLSSGPSWAGCEPLIKEGRELLGKANLPTDEASKVKTLLNEAQKYLDANDHRNGVPTAKKALDLLKKK